MEGKGRLLGWIAIGIGVLSLMVALGGRSQGSSWAGWSGFDRQVPMQPPANVAPPSNQPAPGFIGPRGGAGPQLRGGPQDGRGFQFGPRGFPGFAGQQHRGLFSFLMMPFMLLRGLSRLLLFGLLIFLAVKFLKRRRDNGGSWGRPGGPSGPSGPSGPTRPGPEQPPYTGETQNL
jgi:hypothetical protein